MNSLIGRFNNQKSFSTLCFILFFSWILSFPFEGQIIYGLLEGANIEPASYVLSAVLAHFIGLFSCGFFVKKQSDAKITMVVCILICIAGSLVFFIEYYKIWIITLVFMSYCAGFFVSSVAFYIRDNFTCDQRHKVVADVLIYSNILMIFTNIVTVNISTQIGLTTSVLILLGALYFAIKLDMYQLNDNSFQQMHLKSKKSTPSIIKPFLILCVFITIITVNSGLMYQVVTPAFSHLKVIASYYWAIPYILALVILRNLPRRINQAYILYAALTMIGLSYIAFMLLDTSIFSYLIIDTLMLGAFGVCDLFWWSIIANFLDYTQNPAKILGIGLSMNVLGVLIGGVVGNQLIHIGEDTTNISVLALVIIFIVLMILPLLNIHLTRVFNKHRFLVKFANLNDKEQDEMVLEYKYAGLLTEKEMEVVRLLLKGYTYKAIADYLYISNNTVKYHAKNIYQKLNINSKMELIKLFSDVENKNPLNA